MSAVLSALIVSGLPALLAGSQLSQSLRSADHFMHLTVIGLIRRNGHRFIRERPNYLYNQEMIYPQLMHWLLAFLPVERVDQYANSLMLGLNVLASGIFVWFVVSLEGRLPIAPSTSPAQTILIAGLVFALTPYSYHLANAKSRGISARGFGLLFGQAYLYCLVLYHLTGSAVYLVAASFCAMCIWMSSQFALQALLFSALPLALLYRDVWPLIIPLLGFAGFLLLAPRIALRYVVGQVKHKILFARELAPGSLLKSRYSVWRDLVWDFWKRLGEALAGDHRRGRILRWLFYAWSNPLVILVAGFPFTVLLLVGMVRELLSGDRYPFLADRGLFALCAPVLAMFCVFLLTTFRATRFVGQPERYLEFAIGPTAATVPFLWSEQRPLVIALLAGCGTLIVVQMVVFLASVRKRVDVFGYYDRLAEINEQLAALEAERDDETRLLSNDVMVMRTLMTPDRKIFFGSRYDPWVGGFHMKDVFPVRNGIFADEFIPRIICKFSINTLVLNLDLVKDPGAVLADEQLQFDELAAVGNLRLFKVRPRWEQAEGTSASQVGRRDLAR